jgi:DNA helicase HerA-like ATPase
MLQAPELACMFQPGNKRVVFDELDSFIADQAARVLRISFKHLPFVHDAREILANALGRHVLNLARSSKFRECPLLLFLDEAHHFLNKTLGDEDTRYPLDSFELIAKEGRKLSLNICISTQRPRDIPEGLLSQMGTLIIHRLRNNRDRELVERASSDADRSAMTFVPELGAGQAVIVGVDFPISLPVQVTRPTQPPDSRGPDFQTQWQQQ